MPVAILAIVIGRALDKYSVKNFMMIGAVIYAIGLFSLSFINSYWSLLTIYLTILAFGVNHDGKFSSSKKLISNWFDKNAGRALGIAAVGISFSGVVLPLVVDPLLDLVGWRNVYVIFASVILFIILPLIFTVIDDPKSVNQAKDGIKRENEEESLPQEMTAKDLLSKEVFWIISLTCFSISFHDGCAFFFAYTRK